MDYAASMMTDHKHTSYILGELRERKFEAEVNKVCISSMSEPQKTMTFTVNRLAHCIATLSEIDEEAKKLNQTTRTVACCREIGDGYYHLCVGQLRHDAYGLLQVLHALWSDHDQVCPGRNGIDTIGQMDRTGQSHSEYKCIISTAGECEILHQ